MRRRGICNLQYHRILDACVGPRNLVVTIQQVLHRTEQNPPTCAVLDSNLRLFFFYARAVIATCYREISQPPPSKRLVPKAFVRYRWEGTGREPLKVVVSGFTSPAQGWRFIHIYVLRKRLARHLNNFPLSSHHSRLYGLLSCSDSNRFTSNRSYVVSIYNECASTSGSSTTPNVQRHAVIIMEPIMTNL